MPRGNPLGEPPFNPLVASFGWLALNMRMFITLLNISNYRYEKKYFN